MPGMAAPGGEGAPQPGLSPALRLVLAVSLDGRLAPAQGGAAQLGGVGDRWALEEALAWADACLIGAQTLRLHGTTCLIHHDELLQRRCAAGRPPQPLALVVSRSGRLSPALPFFAQPLERWLLHGPQGEAGAPGFHRQLPLAPWPVVLPQLAAAGLRRVVVLGGAQLAASLLAARQVQELQLTLCPRVLGGPHGWIPLQGRDGGRCEGWVEGLVEAPVAGDDASAQLAQALSGQAWELLAHTALEGGELLLRYRRSTGEQPG